MSFFDFLQPKLFVYREPLLRASRSSEKFMLFA
jgi:hypothetical protein